MSVGQQSEWQTFLEVIELLDTHGIHYMLTGSLAKTVYAMPRMTRDIDIVVELQVDETDILVRAFEKSFYIDKKMVEEAVANSSMFNVLHNHFQVKVDFIVRKNEAYRIVEFQRRNSFVLQGKKVWVVSAEDLVLSKLNWAKDSFSEMQLSDVKDLLQSVKNLDMGYIEKWVESLGLQVVFSKVRE